MSVPFRRWGVAVVLLGALGLSAPARADVLDVFRAACIDTDARTEQVAEAAFRFGWKIAPPRPRMESPKPGEIEVILSNPAAPDEEEIRASTFIPKVPQPVEATFALCMVMTDLSTQTLRAGLEKAYWPAFANDKNQLVWIWSRRDGAMVAEPGLFNGGQEAFEAALRDRSIYILVLITEQDGSGSLVLSAMRRPD